MAGRGVKDGFPLDLCYVGLATRRSSELFKGGEQRERVQAPHSNVVQATIVDARAKRAILLAQ